MSIKYNLFGEKMSNADNAYWFTGPVSLTSAVDRREHKSLDEPTVQAENPFALSPTARSIISNPSGLAQSLLSQ